MGIDLKMALVLHVGEKLKVTATDSNGGSKAAGRAWVRPDGSLTVELDVLPLDGRLCIRRESSEVPGDL